MLVLLTDEHLTPAAAEQVHAKRPTLLSLAFTAGATAHSGEKRTGFSSKPLTLKR